MFAADLWVVHCVRGLIRGYIAFDSNVTQLESVRCQQADKVEVRFKAY